MHNVFDNEPGTWQELQGMVGQLFTEIGCVVEICKIVKLVRGAKEIDVYVEDPMSTPPSTYLCECKFWNKPIPQEVVHAFRTVVADFGANQNFIIAKVGFQSGSIKAVENTNVKLLTFDDLQKMFFNRWLPSMVARYMPYADRLFPYWDYPGRMPKVKWEERDIEYQRLLIEAYSPLLDLGPIDTMMGFNRKFPIELPKINDSFEVEGRVIINTHREYFNFIEANKDKAFSQFQVLYGERRA